MALVPGGGHRVVREGRRKGHPDAKGGHLLQGAVRIAVVIRTRRLLPISGLVGNLAL